MSLEPLSREARQYDTVNEFSKAMYEAHQAICKWKNYDHRGFHVIATKYLHAAFDCLKTDTITTAIIELSPDIDISKFYKQAQKEKKVLVAYKKSLPSRDELYKAIKKEVDFAFDDVIYDAKIICLCTYITKEIHMLITKGSING